MEKDSHFEIEAGNETSAMTAENGRRNTENYFSPRKSDFQSKEGVNPVNCEIGATGNEESNNGVLQESQPVEFDLDGEMFESFSESVQTTTSLVKNSEPDAMSSSISEKRVGRKNVLPSLRGHLSRQGNNVHWTGKWGMDESAFTEGGILSHFTYKRVEISKDQSSNTLIDNVHVLPGESEGTDSLRNALFSGNFSIMINGRNKKIQENKVLFEFSVDELLPSNNIRVVGSGSNQFGSYELWGSLNLSSSELNLVREYKALPVSASSGATPVSIKKQPSSRQKPLPAPTVIFDERSRNQRVRRTPSHLVSDLIDDSTADAIQRMKAIVRDVMRADRDGWFCVPVDAEQLGLRNYNKIVTRRMDLGTIIKKIDAREYSNNDDIIEDVRTTFTNATKYNPPGNGVHIAAKRYLALFESQLQKFLASQERAQMRKSGASEARKNSKNGRKSGGGRTTNRMNDLFGSDGDDSDNYNSEVSGDEIRGKKRPAAKATSPKRKSTGNHKRKSNAEVRGLQDELKMLRKQMEMFSQLHQATLASQMQQMQDGLPIHGGQPFASLPPSKANAPAQRPAKPGFREMTFQEKRQLCADIRKLPEDMHLGIGKIMEDSGNVLQGDDAGEVEFDPDVLDAPVLRKIQKYVRRCLIKLRSNV